MRRTSPSDRAVAEAVVACGGGIRSARKRLGLTQTQVASAIGVTQSTLSRAEQGKKALSLPQMLLLVRVLELGSIDELFGPAATGRMMRA